MDGKATMTLGLALIGAGRIGSNHAGIVAHQVPGARLVAVADPVEIAAKRLAAELDADAVDVETLLGRPDVDGVLITAPARSHTDLVVAAAAAGKHVFCEKPMAVTLADADRAIAAAEQAGIVLQVGFNRRFAPAFAAARAAIDAGRIGTPQLLRSLTRDPGPFTADPARIPQWTIFFETLIHDFDTLCFLNPGARPVAVHAFADALVAPEARGSGHLDTAVVTIRFDNGAIATAEANFSALYGYDVRGEAFGSAGMVTAGTARVNDMTLYDAGGIHVDTARRDTDLLHAAYAGEIRAFVEAVRTGGAVPGAGRDRPHRAGDRPGRDRERRDRNGGDPVSFTLAASAEMLYLDLPLLDRVKRITERGLQVEIWDWSTKDIDALAASGATFSSMTGYLRGDLTTPDGIAELLATAEESLAVAERLDSPRLNLHGTGLDGKGLPVRPVEVVTPAMWLTAADTLRRVAELGERANRVFTLENLNLAVDHPGTPFARAADTLALARAVDSPHLRLNLDLYHAQIGEGNLIELVREALPYIGEIQVADVPGRCEPGTGEINYRAVATALTAAGYTGVIGLEAWAQGDPDAALDAFEAAFAPQ